MPWPLLSATNLNIDNLDTTSNSIHTSIEIHTQEEEVDNEVYNYNQLTIRENDSLLTSLNRICIYWRQTILNKIRFILTLVFVTMLNIATRLTCFTRQRTLAARSTPPLSTSSSISQLEEDLDHSSTSLINFNSQIDLPSSDNSTMAHILVQQQTHQTTSTQNQNHSVDNGLFFYNQDSRSILQLFQRIAADPQMSMYHSTSNGYLNKNAPIFPLPNTNLPQNQPEQKVEEEEEEKEINNLNCDKIEPVIKEDTTSDQLDNLSTIIVNDELDEDAILTTNSSANPERHFRRRKRRISLTRTSSSSNETESLIIDSIEKVDNNNNNEEKKFEEINENLEPISVENLTLNDNNEKKEDNLMKNEQLNEKTLLHNRFRIRRSRYRSHLDTLTTSQKSTSDKPVEFYVSTESPITTPPSSPVSSTSNVPSCTTNSNLLTGKLKRTGSLGTTKKMVRFADSVGRELAQVQYIHPLFDDDCKEFSFIKNNLYIPKLSNFEHKPWSFDITSTSKQISDYRLPKRFFCLYRQPNSEHADIYLHEIWRTQIKLEHADIRVKSYTTNEQHLHGTLWVTNASYSKYVTVKYTFNQWLNSYEYEARHVCHSNDFRNIDQFEFSIDIPNDIDRIDFVLRYCVNGQEYWDNNDGRNYTIETESASTPQTTISLPHDCDFNEMRFY